MSGVGPNVPSMTVKCEVGPVSLRTVERRRHWYVSGCGRTGTEVVVEEDD